MKVLMFMVTILGLAVLTVSAQTATSTDDAGLKIMRVGLQRTVAKGPSLRAIASTDPASQSKAKADRVQDGNSDSNPALHRMSQDAEIAPKTSKQDPLGNMSSPYPVIYVASVVVKNIGTKTVIAVRWEYLLFEVGGTDPVKRYRVQSKITIAPGEQAELTKEVTPKGHEQQARLTRIEYADGSVWQAKP